MTTLTLYYSPSCAFSAGTIAFMLLRGADFRLVNLEQHDEERARLERDLAGKKLETPLISAGDGLYVAPSLSELKRLLEAWDVPPEASPHEQLERAEKNVTETASVTRLPSDS